jgi:hypothetical protein
MAKQINTGIKLETPKKKRPGTHAKSSSSKIKSSKKYKKKYVGQGR